MKRKNFLKILLISSIPLVLLGATVFILIISQGGTGPTGDNAGVVKINTDPVNIEIRLFVDNNVVEPLNNKGANISAGTHLLRVEAAGMANWEKKVTITKGIVTEVYAKLFPLKMELTQVTNSNVDKVFFTSGNDYVFYVVKNSELASEKGIWKMQLTQNNLFFMGNNTTPVKFSDLDKSFSSLFEDPDYSISISPDANRMLLNSPKNSMRFLISAQVLNQKPVIENLNDKLGYYPKKVSWFNASGSLLIEDEHALFEYNLSSGTSTLIKYVPDQAIIDGANTSQVIFYDKTNQRLNSYKNQSIQSLELKNFNLPLDITGIFLAEKTNRFFAIATAKSFYFIDSEKNSYKEMPTGEAILLQESADGLSYYFQDKQGALFAYTVTENLGLNVLETKTSKLPFILTPTTDKLVISPLSTNIIYLSGKDASIYSFDRDGANQIKLLNSVNIKPFFHFDSTASNLFVLIQDETANPTSSAIQPRSNIYKLNLMKNTP